MTCSAHSFSSASSSCSSAWSCSSVEPRRRVPASGLQGSQWARHSQRVGEPQLMKHKLVLHRQSKTKSRGRVVKDDARQGSARPPARPQHAMAPSWPYACPHIDGGRWGGGLSERAPSWRAWRAHLLVTVPSSPTRQRISGEEATMMQPRAWR